MVVFTCTHCGESLQKSRVEKHYQTTCKNHPIAVSCMDCFKDFKMQEYAAHVKCVTEEERYAAKGTVMNPKKGEAKQTSWIETVNAIIEKEKNAKPEVRKLLETISKHSNIPRKKTKFVNFMNSTTGGSAKPEDIEAVWDLLESHKPPAEDKNKEGKLDNARSNKKRKPEMTADDNTESGTPQKKKKANKSKEERDVSDAAAPAAEAEQKPPKKKKADKKPDEKNASESEPAAVAADKAKNAKRKKRKSGDADEEAAPAPAVAEGTPAPAATANSAAAQNGDVPKKKKKTTTPAAASTENADATKKETPKKKKNSQQTQSMPAAAAGENADVAPKKSKKKAAAGEDKPDVNNAAVDEKSSAKKKKDKTKSMSNGEMAADAKKTSDGDKKKEKKDKEGGDKSAKINWEESVRSIVKSKPSGITKDELIEQLFTRQAAAGEEIHSKSKLRKHIIKLLYKMPDVKVDKDSITPAN